jgi:diguanylate cyclase (GGDEF)-like protein
VVLIDLDEFKPVNDLYGHEAGDMLLQTLALRMKKQLSDTAGLGRLGGDEFVVLLAGQTVSSIAELEALGETLLAVISEPVTIKPGVRVNVRASIGVSLCQVESHTLSTALRAADAAMYDIKHNGKNGVVVVSESDFPESVTM